MGSTSYISTRNGSISQHVEYIAFGEILFEEHSSSFSSPYLFNGKELDRETNLSYYGARYLDMKTSLWLSVDPKKEKYPNYGAYAYCFNSPLRFVDPTGMEGEDGINSSVKLPTPKEVYKTVLSYLPKAQRKNIEKIVRMIEKKVGNIDYSKLAIGIENTVGFEASAGIKTEGNAISGNVIFLGGNDAGYVYGYRGGEVGIGGETSLTSGVNAGSSYYVAYNHSGKGGHKTFDGDYTYERIGAGAGADTGLITNIVGVNAGVGLSLTYGKGSDWELYSLGGAINASIGFSASITESYTKGSGKVNFINRSNVGKPKSFYETLGSYWKILSPFN
nr:RHS repeat-associated core domain-containing protein [Flavobacterium sp. 7E]